MRKVVSEVSEVSDMRTYLFSTRTLFESSPISLDRREKEHSTGSLTSLTSLT